MNVYAQDISDLNARLRVFVMGGPAEIREFPPIHPLMWGPLSAAVGGFALLYLVAKPAFTIVFGAEWIESAVFTRILIPMIAIRFVTSPLSIVFYIAGRQKEDFLWQVVFFLATAFGMMLGVLFEDIYYSLISFSFSGSIMYALYFYMIRAYATDRSRVVQ